ncbi:hypothetical protein CDAR_301961 [Caerostris darwini]|uniref:Uncharacterized protein n=1 Tax=Caerostris darwini TaxID=1538125 RepID=A0AAV4UGX6_9ARAC|nr:hypothetical protein CDAR_301961 [Caerostris darwini]
MRQDLKTTAEKVMEGISSNTPHSNTQHVFYGLVTFHLLNKQDFRGPMDLGAIYLGASVTSGAKGPASKLDARNFSTPTPPPHRIQTRFGYGPDIGMDRIGQIVRLPVFQARETRFGARNSRDITSRNADMFIL